MSDLGGFNVARCPKCHALDVRSSRLQWSDFLAMILLRKMARCGTCKTRFSTWLAVAPDMPPAKKVVVRKKVRMRTRVKVREKVLLGNE